MKRLTLTLIFWSSILTYSSAQDSPDCDPKFLGGKYSLQHPTNCDQFYSCTNGSAQLYQCEDGYAYSQYFGCKLLHLVDCSSRPILQPAKKTKDCPRLYGIFQDYRECSAYYRCYNGTAKMEKCKTGMIFDDKVKICREATDGEKKACQQPALLTCNIGQNGQYELCSWFRCPPPDSLQPGEHTKHPFSGNCHHYIACFQDGSIKVGKCEKTKTFDISSKTCQKNDISNCKSKSELVDFDLYNIEINQAGSGPTDYVVILK